MFEPIAFIVAAAIALLAFMGKKEDDAPVVYGSTGSRLYAYGVYRVGGDDNAPVIFDLWLTTTTQQQIAHVEVLLPTDTSTAEVIRFTTHNRKFLAVLPPTRSAVLGELLDIPIIDTTE